MNLSLWIHMHQSHDSPSFFSIVQVAREMRKEPTLSEARFWQAVCNKQLGVRVRRQHVLHPYVVDFFVASARLVIEIDGAVHDGVVARERDAMRTAELVRLYDVRVIRFGAGEVEGDVLAIVERVRRELA